MSAMKGKLRLLMFIGILGIAIYSRRAFAQNPQTPIAPKPGEMAPTDAEVLPDLRQPPDMPRSLFRPPAPTPPYTCDPLPGPYVEHDLRLDPPSLPPPGWFTATELSIIGAHVKNRLVDVVEVGERPIDRVHLGSAELDWTPAPRIELGYCLPSGFGAFSVSYRFFDTDGSQSIIGPDAPAVLRSRLDVNTVDLDYFSREFFTCQWPYVHMKWRFGLRWADAFFDSRLEEPFSAAAAGGGIFETHVSNNFWGVGPHAGLELTRRCGPWGLMFVSSVDAATLLGRIRQNFFEESTTLDSGGQPLAGNIRRSVSQDVPIINAFVGLGWQPPCCQCLSIYAGYAYEYWWNVGRNSDTSSRGELSDQGVLLRAEVKW
jgi:hypothetical protein